MARALQCPTCGAPLKWKGVAQVVECRYCHTHVQTNSGIAVQEQAQVVSQPKTPVAVLAGAAIAAFVVIGAAIAFAALGRGGAGGVAGVRGMDAATVKSIDLAKTPDQMGKLPGANPSSSEGYVYINLDHELWQSATFGWDKQHLDHVRNVSLNAHSQQKLPAAVLERAKAQLGTLRESSTGGHSYHGPGANLSLSDTAISISVHKYEEGWKERVQALWIVLKHAAFNASETLPTAKLRDVLNTGYPLERLTKVPIDVDIDGSQAALKRVIPGVTGKGAKYRVGVGHPWIEYADLNWKNEAKGKLSGVNLFYPPSFSLKAQREEVEGCLTPLLGKPKESVSDHAKGIFTLHFKGKDGMPSVLAHYQYFGLYMQPWDAPAVTRAGYEKLIRKLASCGKP